MKSTHLASAVMGAIALQQPQLPPKSAAFDLATLEAQLAASSKPYLSFLDVPTLRVGLYRLDAGATDEQTPHLRDETYQVISGKAVLDVAGTRYDAKAGSVLFVAANTEHRFVDIEEALTTLVFFSEQLPTTGGMAAGPVPVKQTPYPETSGRGSTRIFYWFGPGSAGQVEIDFGLPRWQAAFGSFIQRAGGLRWRFGQDFWTRLDSNIDLTIGGVLVPAGYYYLVLEHDAEHGLRVIALDSADVKKARLDAYQAPQTTGGIAIPLTIDDAFEGFADRLGLELAVVDRDANAAMLTVTFGPMRMTAPVLMHPAR